MLYAHKNGLVSVARVTEKGTLLTQSGELPVFPNELILCDQHGNTYPVSEKWFNENYIEVEKVQPKPSQFEQEYTKQLMEFGSLENNIEDQEYIDGQRKLIANKPF
jgi:hypothetical protein